MKEAGIVAVSDDGKADQPLRDSLVQVMEYLAGR